MILPKESATFSSCRFNFFRLSLIPNSRYLENLMRLEDVELEFIEHFFRGNFRPELLFDEHTSNNLMMHPVVLRTLQTLK